MRWPSRSSGRMRPGRPGVRRATARRCAAGSPTGARPLGGGIRRVVRLVRLMAVADGRDYMRFLYRAADRLARATFSVRPASRGRRGTAPNPRCNAHRHRLPPARARARTSSRGAGAVRDRLRADAAPGGIARFPAQRARLCRDRRSARSALAAGRGRRICRRGRAQPARRAQCLAERAARERQSHSPGAADAGVPCGPGPGRTGSGRRRELSCCSGRRLPRPRTTTGSKAFGCTARRRAACCATARLCATRRRPCIWRRRSVEGWRPEPASSRAIPSKRASRASSHGNRRCAPWHRRPRTVSNG